MGPALAKVLMSLLTGLATAALAWATGHLGTNPAPMDAVITTVLVGLLTRLMGYLTAKAPAPTP